MHKESWSYKTENTVRDIAISADGKFIAAGSYDNHVYFLDREGNLLWRYKTGNTVRDIGISYKGDYIIVGSYDNKAYFFNKEGKLLWEFKTKNAIREVTITSKGDFTAFGSDDKTAYFFNKEGDLLWKYKTGNTAGRIELSADGSFAVVGSLDRNVYFFNKMGNILWNFEADNWIETVRISQDGNYIVAGSDDKNLYFFNKSGKLLWNYRASGAFERAAISQHGSFVCAGSEGKVYFFNKYGQLLWKHTTGIYDVKGIAMSSGGNIINIGTRDNEIICFDKKGRLLWDYKTGNWVECITSTSRGSYVVAGTRDGKILFFNNIKFFDAMIKNLEKKIYDVKIQGLVSEDAEKLLLNAKTSFAERKYLMLIEFVFKAKNAIKENVHRVTPEISICIVANKDFLTRTWTQIKAFIQNKSLMDIYGITIDFSGNFIVSGELKKTVIKAGKSEELTFSLKPFESGKLPIKMKFSYRDVDKKMHYIERESEIESKDEGIEIKPKELFRIGKSFENER